MSTRGRERLPQVSGGDVVSTGRLAGLLEYAAPELAHRILRGKKKLESKK